MGRKNRRQEPRPTPTTPSATGRRYAAQAELYAADNVVPIRQPGITADWLSGLLNGERRQAPNYLEQANSTAGTALHEWAEQAYAGERVQDGIVMSRTELAQEGLPPCSIDPDPWRPEPAAPAAAIDRVMPAMVDVLRAITRELETLRDDGPPDRADGVTNGERDAWRAALQQAVFITSGASLVASGFPSRRPR